MAVINMDSIISKAKKYTETKEFKKLASAKIDNAMLHGTGLQGKNVTIRGANEAALKFIEILQNEISSRAGSILSASTYNLQCGAPIKIGENKYQIGISFSGDLHRDSLAPDFFNGVDNIVALLNKGYSASSTIYGTWPGHGYADSFNIPSLRQRAGLHFIESAMSSYMAGYADKYGVINITVDSIYT